MPRAPSSLSPLITSSGIRASRSMRAASIFVSQKSRSLARNSSPRCASSAGGQRVRVDEVEPEAAEEQFLGEAGLAPVLFPGGLGHLAGLPLGDCRVGRGGWLAGLADMRHTSPRIGILRTVRYRSVLLDRWYPITGGPTSPRAAIGRDRPSGTPARATVTGDVPPQHSTAATVGWESCHGGRESPGKPCRSASTTYGHPTRVGLLSFHPHSPLPVVVIRYAHCRSASHNTWRAGWSPSPRSPSTPESRRAR